VAVKLPSTSDDDWFVMFQVQFVQVGAVSTFGRLLTADVRANDPVSEVHTPSHDDVEAPAFAVTAERLGDVGPEC
jgi:hypothetical protein